MARCLVIQHLEPERSYAIGEALAAAGSEVDVRRIFAGEDLPATVSGFDGLVVMGGPMSATSDDGFPTRLQEISLLTDALGEGVPILGVCLGAQLLAVAAGGSVVRGAAGQEIGWGPVELTEAAAEDPLLADVADDLTVLHWHGETFELPIGAAHLASSPQYANQAFRVGDRAWGFQFHLEVDERAVTEFIDTFESEARDADVDPDSIRAASADALDGLAPVRALVTSRFARHVVELDRRGDLVSSP